MKLKKGKKICLVNPTLLLKRPIIEINNLLLDKNYNISIFASKKISEKKKIIMHHTNTKNIITFPIITFSKGSEWPIPVCFLPKAIKILKNNDIIHMWVPFYLSNTILAILKKLFFNHKKLILTMDTVPPYSFSLSPLMNIFFKIYYKTIGKIVFSACDEITFYGDSFAEISKKIGIPRKKIRVTTTGVNLKTKLSTKNIREELKIKNSQKIIFSIGICCERKGVDTFIKIAKKMKNKNLVFIWCGAGPQLEMYKKMAGNFVKFVGFRKDLPNFLNEADIFLFPSRGEGLAGVIFEAMVYGIPVVTSNIIGTKDIIQDNKSGFLCKMNNTNEYIIKINKILGDSKLKNKFIRFAKKTIKEKFNWKKNIKSFEDLYK